MKNYFTGFSIERQVWKHRLKQTSHNVL